MVSTVLSVALMVVTLSVFTLLGIWYSRGKIRSVEDLITARNTAGSGMTTATLIATSMGAWILFSPAEAGATFGGITAVIGYAIGSALPLLAFIQVGTRVRSLIPEGHSLTEYVYVRYGSIMYVYVLLITVFYMFIFLAAEMTGISGAMALIADVPRWQTAFLIGGFVLIYTVYGGLIASIFTDTLQTLVILPLLLVGFIGAILSLGGTANIYETITSTHPGLLDPGLRVGIEFGVYVMIAILAANMFNQGYWQRVFSAKNNSTVRQSFGVASLAVIPMVFLAGLFGMVASGLGLISGSSDGSIAFFLVLLETFPEWVVLSVVLLVLLLVMSTADTMFNAIASIITADLPLVVEDPDQKTLRFVARSVTVVVAVGAVFVGAQGYSVLSLFLLADLLAAATVFPFLYGLYSKQVFEIGAFVSSIVALIVGIGFFPITYDLLVTIPVVNMFLPKPSFLFSFVGAGSISVVLTVLTSYISDQRFDLYRLSEEIKTLEQPTTKKRNNYEDKNSKLQEKNQ